MDYNSLSVNTHKNNEVEEIPIDNLIYDVLILKAECLRDKKLLGYCSYLEKQLFKIKNGEAKIKG